MQDKKQQQLAALDSQYQAKIMSEVERYQALLQEKELLNHKWDEQNATLLKPTKKCVLIAVCAAHQIQEQAFCTFNPSLWFSRESIWCDGPRWCKKSPRNSRLN